MWKYLPQSLISGVVNRAKRTAAMDYDIPLTPENKPPEDPIRSQPRQYVESPKSEEELHSAAYWREQAEHMRSQLAAAERMAALGQLTAGIGHEIKNLITFIAASIGPLKLDIEDLESVLEGLRELRNSNNREADIQRLLALSESLDTDFLIGEINKLIAGMDEGTRRASDIISSIKHVSRPESPDFVMADLHREIDSTILLIRHKIEGEVTFHRHYGNIPEIACLPGKLNQVFMNILNNAIQAIEEKTPPKGEIHITTEAIAEDWIRIIIRDTGIGMNESVLSRIFDPFYTTKSVERGTGLGLSLSQGFIQKHNGTLLVSSTPGQGTTFEINLPVHIPVSDS